MRVHLSTISLPHEGRQDAPAQQVGESAPLDLPAGATVADVLDRFLDQRELVQKVLVNGDDAEDSRPLKDGDAVALVGLVSGL